MPLSKADMRKRKFMQTDRALRKSIRLLTELYKVFHPDHKDQARELELCAARLEQERLFLVQFYQATWSGGRGWMNFIPDVRAMLRRWRIGQIEGSELCPHLDND